MLPVTASGQPRRASTTHPRRSGPADEPSNSGTLTAATTVDSVGVNRQSTPANEREAPMRLNRMSRNTDARTFLSSARLPRAGRRRPAHPFVRPRQVHRMSLMEKTCLVRSTAPCRGRNPAATPRAASSRFGGSARGGPSASLSHVVAGFVDAGGTQRSSRRPVACCEPFTARSRLQWGRLPPVRISDPRCWCQLARPTTYPQAR